MLTLLESVGGAMHQCYHGPQMVSNCAKAYDSKQNL